MKKEIVDGIPLVSEYKELIKTDEFKKMEIFSDDFLETNKIILGDYMNKWVADPLHQWSRQWEYPYVYNKVKQVIKNEPMPRILDAGSGVTFFPHYLLAQHKDSNVSCCDYDEMLTPLFKKINEQYSRGVEFSIADLRHLPYENESFHIVYCISVLEHTNDYEYIVQEYYRILKPGGTLVVTIDISLDGKRDINVEQGSLLLASLEKTFGDKRNLSKELSDDTTVSGNFTTLTARDINESLLPWKRPSVSSHIKSFVSPRKINSWPPPLTVYCLSLTKPKVDRGFSIQGLS